MALAPTVQVFHPDIEAKAARFSRRMQIIVVVAIFAALAAVGAGVLLFPPTVSQEALSTQLRELPPKLNTAVLSGAAFSGLRDSSVQPIPVSAPRPFPFQP